MPLNNKDLKAYINCTHNSVAIRWLQDNGVKWWMDTKGKPCTTMEAINAALMQSEGASDDLI